MINFVNIFVTNVLKYEISYGIITTNLIKAEARILMSAIGTARGMSDGEHVQHVRRRWIPDPTWSASEYDADCHIPWRAAL